MLFPLNNAVAGTLSLMVFCACTSVRADLVHEYDAGGAGNSHSQWTDVIGGNNLTAAARPINGETKVVFTGDPRASLARAYTATNANMNAGAASGLPTASYTFEIWIHSGGVLNPGEVIFETGGGANGIGLFTRTDGLELATSSVATGADALATISLSGLDIEHYLQVTAVFDISTNTITLTAKDVDGIEVTDSSLSLQPLRTGTANGMGLFAGGNGDIYNDPGNTGGAQATGMSLPETPGVFSGAISLFRIFKGVELEATAASYAKIVLPANRASDPRPNFIVIFTDDHGYADITAQGQDADVWTPHIDRLAAEGVRFTHGYVTAPQCVPSRAGILSGQYQQRFGVDENGKGPMEPSVITIPERLRQAGYRTGMIGKWHLEPNHTDIEWAADNGFNPDNIPESVKKKYYPGQQGFEEFAFGNTHSYWHNFNRNGSDNDPLGVQQEENGHRLDIQSDFAEAFIERNHNRPFFLYLAYFAPHVPLTWVDRYRNTFDPALPEKRRIALGMIKAMDDGVGRILARLSQHNIDEKTIIWFIGDNGAPLGFHESGNIGATDAAIAWDGSLNTPWLGEKGMLAEGGIRVPWLMRWQGTLVPQVYAQPVIALDVGATANALAGLMTDPLLEGVNLMPHLMGTDSNPPHARLYWRFWNQSAIREGKWKYINLAKNSQSFLFDLENDWHETANLIGQYPDIAATLNNHLEAWKAGLPQAGDPGAGLNNQEIAWYRHSFGVGVDDFDSDHDGVANLSDAFPNNPTETLDTDIDGIGNNTDTDDDGDGIPDEYEIANGLNALNAADAGLDKDSDGLSNLKEFQLHTDINNTDTDGDGTDDGDEVNAGRNPLLNEIPVIQIINGFLLDE